MSYADKKFKEMCSNILEHGTDTKGEAVRPKWPDGTSAYTIKTFGVCTVYDLQKEFPALTLRKTGLKSCMDEILWIYQKKSNNIHDLKPHIWDEWADDKGSIGRAYGYQVANITPVRLVNGSIQYMDQMDRVLYELKHTPFSRRIKINLWNVSELDRMRLQPCCFDLTFNVTDEGKEKLVLNLHLTQRSQDILAANNWNVCQYAILLMMVAQASDMIPGKLMHCITDAHIYDRHVPIIKELLDREEYLAPVVKLDPSITNFYDFTTDHLIVENYVAGEQIKNIPIAI